VTITGKLCRNPFSTIKLSHEDGGSKAGKPHFRARDAAQAGHFCAKSPFSPLTILDLLLHAQALCIQSAQGERVIRVAGRND